MPKHAYGYIPDLRDFRDHIYTAPYEHVLALPSSVDLRPQCPPIEDQGQLGSCTSFAAGAAIRFARKKQGLPDFVTSHLFLYYNSRRFKNEDTGATIKDVIKSAAKQGDCPESEWPYVISKFTVKPPAQCYSDALKDRALSYQRVQQNLSQMKACLASGFPVVVGISVYESFESDEVAKTGMVPMPQPGEQLLGGHAICVVGFNDATQKWIFRNSWGLSWADGGYGYLDYQYLLNNGLSSDFWTIKTVG